MQAASPTAPLNAIFHNNQGGDSNQTGNIEGLSGDNYFTYDGTSGYTTESAPVPDPTPQPGKEITIYCESAQAPFIWAWDGDGNNLVSGEWPGEQLSATKVVGGRTFYYKTFTASSVNCIFSYTGDADKSADLGPFTSDQYFTFSAGNATNITHRRSLRRQLLHLRRHERLHHRERTRSRSYTSAWRQDHGICKGIKCTSSVCMVHGRRDRR